MKNRQTLPCKSLLAASHKFQGRLKQAQRDQPRLLQREYFLAIELLVNYPLSVIEVSAMALHLWRALSIQINSLRGPTNDREHACQLVLCKSLKYRITNLQAFSINDLAMGHVDDGLKQRAWRSANHFNRYKRM